MKVIRVHTHRVIFKEDAQSFDESGGRVIAIGDRREVGKQLRRGDTRLGREILEAMLLVVRDAGDEMEDSPELVRRGSTHVDAVLII